MSEEPENKPVRIPKWLWVGSAIWLICVFSFAWLLFWPNATGGLKPNEFGDLLAGAFSPLAFAWFVYAVFMQRQELELQRNELTETRSVLKDQEKAQRDLTEQTSISNNLTRRNLIDEQIQYLSKQLCSLAYRKPTITFQFSNESCNLWIFDPNEFNNDSIYIYSKIHATILGLPEFNDIKILKHNIDHNLYCLNVAKEALMIQSSIVSMCYQAKKTGINRDDEQIQIIIEEKLRKICYSLEAKLSEA
ncbi:MAG: hypothetical protein IOC52_02555 [Methylobacterium sp.]|nr:hypothetical protein [Methylobacterium sp.]